MTRDEKAEVFDKEVRVEQAATVLHTTIKVSTYDPKKRAEAMVELMYAVFDLSAALEIDNPSAKYRVRDGQD